MRNSLGRIFRLQTLIGVICCLSAGSMATIGYGQTEKLAVPASDFHDLKVKVVELRLNGSAFVYRAKVFVPDDALDPVPVFIPRSVKYTYMVPRVKEIDGKQVTEMKAETRDRTVMTTVMKAGSYQMKSLPINSEAQFFSLTGKRMTTQEAIRQVGMKNFHVLLLPQNEKIPELWKHVFNANTLVLKYKKPLKGQNAATGGIR